jgi:hypothetical protein
VSRGDRPKPSAEEFQRWVYKGFPNTQNNNCAIKFEKPLDKLHKVWYNSSVVREREQSNRFCRSKDFKKNLKNLLTNSPTSAIIKTSKES